LKGTTQLKGWRPNLASTTTYQNNKAIREIKSSKARSLNLVLKKWYPNCEYAQIQLIFNLEKTQRQYKENVDEH